MDVLILLRHGKAVRDHEAANDKARGLTERGQRDAALAGLALAEAGLKPDIVLVSTAARASQTYDALAPTLGPHETRRQDGLYMAPASAVWNAAEKSGGSRVLVIGHNPGLQELAADLIGQACDRSAAGRSLAEHLATSAFAAFALTGSRRDAAGPSLLAHWSPKA